jgi:hypothetical protein
MMERGFQSNFKPWKIGEKVWLSSTNITTHLPSRKLAPKCHGPFTISAVLSPISYQLDLPPNWRIHPVFHATELSAYKETEVHGPNFTFPSPDLINGEEEFEIEAIISHRKLQNKLQYLVSWKGYPSSDNSWLPEKDLTNAKEILKTYKNCLQLARLLL